VWRSIGGAAAVMGVVAFVGLMMLFAARAFGGNAPTAAGVITTETVIAAVRQVYGIGGVIVVAVIVAPITEELVFRSAMLDVFAKYAPFLVVNGMRALLFAAEHGEIKRMQYLFVVGTAGCGGDRAASYPASRSTP
jgi:membrane protease YdiL (CAAX protease family)